MRGFFLGVVLALVWCGSAQASTVIAGPTERAGQLQAWVETSRLPTPDVTIEVHDKDCTEVGSYEGSSCAWQSWEGSTPTIWLNPSADRETFMHELGHHFDFAELTDPRRAAFMALLRRERPRWDTDVGAPSANECFASAYALTAMGRGYRGETACRRQALKQRWAFRLVVEPPSR